MIIEISIPSPGESITEVELSNWLVSDGDYVEKDQEVAEVESEKATLPLIAEKAGKIHILIEEGETIKVGTIACKIDTDAEPPPDKNIVTEDIPSDASAYKKEKESISPEKETKKDNSSENKVTTRGVKITPVARKMMEEHHLSPDDIVEGLRKITSKDVQNVLSENALKGSKEAKRTVSREKISNLRRKLSNRLVAVKNETAMLTTFNEADMSRILAIRKNYQEEFTEKHGIKLGLMSFFVKAATISLQAFPKVNSMIDGEEILTPGYVDISIAVQTDKGLMVPVLRNTEMMSLADIEHSIKDLADKARKFRLSIEEMEGGTFTITNGGVFGSMLSTPIINPPQSGILGMHNIAERPVAVNGKVEIRPVMYIALSYDHRIVDGKDSVSFLVKVKELIEDPVKMLTGGSEAERVLLEL